MEGISPRRRRLEKKQKRRKGLIWLLKAGIAFILLLVVWVTFNQVKMLAIQRLIKVEKTSFSIQEETVHLSGAIIKGETIITAPVTGKMRSVVPEGKRVRVGEILAHVRAVGTTGEIEGQDFPIVSPVAGMVSYHFDGLEQVLAPKTLEDLDLNKIDQMVSQKGLDSVTNGQVKKGEALAKIVDNIGGLEIYATFGKGALTRQLELGQIIELRVAGVEDTIRAQVKNVQSTPEKWRILLATSRFLPQALGGRQIQFELIARRLSGIMLPQKALVEENHRTGVYVFSTKGIKWREIKQVGAIGDQVAVEGIPEGIPVVINPRLIDK